MDRDKSVEGLFAQIRHRERGARWTYVYRGRRYFVARGGPLVTQPGWWWRTR